MAESRTHASWPMFCRAAAQIEAYEQVLDWLARRSIDEVRLRIKEKIDQKQHVCANYKAVPHV